MFASFLHMLLALAGALASAGVLFLLITRRVRPPSGDSQ